MYCFVLWAVWDGWLLRWRARGVSVWAVCGVHCVCCVGKHCAAQWGSRGFWQKFSGWEREASALTSKAKAARNALQPHSTNYLHTHALITPQVPLLTKQDHTVTDQNIVHRRSGRRRSGRRRSPRCRSPSSPSPPRADTRAHSHSRERCQRRRKPSGHGTPPPSPLPTPTPNHPYPAAPPTGRRYSRSGPPRRTHLAGPHARAPGVRRPHALRSLPALRCRGAGRRVARPARWCPRAPRRQTGCAGISAGGAGAAAPCARRARGARRRARRRPKRCRGSRSR